MILKKTIQLECGQIYLTELGEREFLELGDVFMSREKEHGTRPYRFQDFEKPDDTEKRVMTVCTMLGCSGSCNFCASRNSYKRNLSAEEIVDQVDFMIQEGVKNDRNLDPNNSKEFRVLYTRMGEPMLNATNVLNSIKELKARFPHTIIGMSTSGYKKGLDQFLENPELLPSIDLQFSLHSTNDKERNYLFGGGIGKTKLSIPEISEYINKWYEASGKKVCLNNILFEDFEYDFKGQQQYFDKDKVWLRLSPWNVINNVEGELEGLLKTSDVLKKKPITSDQLKKVIQNIEEAGFAYSYAPAIDEEIKYNVACGQALEAFKGDLD